jgi:hypothetical protein
MTEEVAFGGALRAVRSLSNVAMIHSLKLKNNLSAAFALRGMCNRGFDFA